MNPFLVSRNRGFHRFGVFNNNGEFEIVPNVLGPKNEFDKKVRREIANSNERRRMQSINAGFDSLRILLPSISDGERMSKASILQLTANYIQTLLNRISCLENEIYQLHNNNSLIQPKSCDTRKRPLDFQRDSHEEFTTANLKIIKTNSDPQENTLSSNCNVKLKKCILNSEMRTSQSAPTIKCVPDDLNINGSSRLEHLVKAIEQIEKTPQIFIENSAKMNGHKLTDILSTDKSPKASHSLISDHIG